LLAADLSCEGKSIMLILSIAVRHVQPVDYILRESDQQIVRLFWQPNVVATKKKRLVCIPETSTKGFSG
jgi:hypothetical protein